MQRALLCIYPTYIICDIRGARGALFEHGRECVLIGVVREVFGSSARKKRKVLAHVYTHASALIAIRTLIGIHNMRAESIRARLRIRLYIYEPPRKKQFVCGYFLCSRDP